MKLELINKLFQNLKHYLNTLIFKVAFNSSEEHLVEGDELMGNKQKKVQLTELEYKEFLANFPGASPSVVKKIGNDGYFYSIIIKELCDIQKRDGKEAISDDCIEYVKSKNKSKKSNLSPHTDKSNSKNFTNTTQFSHHKSQRLVVPTANVNTALNRGFENALLASGSNEIPSLADQKQAESKNSIELSILDLSLSEVNNQQEIATQQCVKSEQATSNTSESSSIKQDALVVTNNTSQTTLFTEIKVPKISETESETFVDETITQLVSTDQSLASLEEFTDIQEKLTDWKWRRVFDAVVGSSHLKANPSIPCQDAALAVLVPRPAIFVADGAGSARLSHFGSSAVVRYLNRFIASIEDINQEFLDQDRQQEIDADKRYAYRFIKYTIGILQELSQVEKEPIDLFKCTLLITIIGKSKLFWLKIGDGSIVIEKDQALELIGPLGKGDFANQTTFVTENITDKDIHYGFLDVQHVTAVAAFTDGAAEKLVTANGLQISRTLSKIFHHIRTGEYTQDDLHQFLSKKDIWLKTTGDDKGIAILSYLL
ncbi:PP2C family serine/threonine-protein phosphatase [Chlorogloea sp. CCALA 695]|uniref:PP2C family serine/threonine-protein phosphatase n=1 Tax=Chlorogloea sp. CCALA 695 TaxID=2107693 RepID=UPI000D07D622|nr:PP2C family serine/threonine-protein phosphatase [Chlorogloea sp. CCALA 695]PSB27088.1 hypothetical protein C7B70_23155 [Chlorogloea sp. CCALA 695]